MSTWSSLDNFGRVRSLNRIFAEGGSFAVAADALGTTRSAIAGFCLRHPEISTRANAPRGRRKMPEVQAVASTKFRPWNDMTDAERIAAVRALCADGRTSRSAMAKALDISTAKLDKWRSANRQELNADPHSRTFSGLSRSQRIVANRNADSALGTLHKTISVALVPSMETPETEDRPGRQVLALLPPVAAASAPAGRVSVLTVTDRRCRFPIWPDGCDAPGVGEPAFCGEHIEPGKVYCTAHRRLSYPPAAVRERATRRALE